MKETRENATVSERLGKMLAGTRDYLNDLARDAAGRLGVSQQEYERILGNAAMGVAGGAAMTGARLGAAGVAYLLQLGVPHAPAAPGAPLAPHNQVACAADQPHPSMS